MSNVSAIDVYILILSLSAIFCLLTSVLSFRKRPALGAHPLGILLAAIAVWSFMQALVFSLGSFGAKLFFANLRYLGIELIPIAFYALTYEYTKKKAFFKLKRVYVLLCISALFFIYLVTDPYHHLFYGSVELKDSVLVLGNGVGFWLNILYIYIFVVIGIVNLVIHLFKGGKASRIQTLILFLSTLIPFSGNMVFNFNIIPTGNIDITPLAFTFTGLFCFFGLFKLGLFDVLPIAKGELFENLQDAVMILDKNQNILALNKQALTLLKTINDNDPPEDYIGKPIHEAFSSYQALHPMLHYHGFLKEQICLSVAKELKYFYLLKNQIVNKKGKSKGSVIVLKDITELEIAILEAKASQKVAEDANQAKSRFLANMSHEIRTPMNAIIGISDILYSSTLPPEEQKKNLKILINSAVGLLGILNDILDYSKIEAGRLELENTVICLKELLDETVDTFVIQAMNKNIEFKTQLEEDLPPYILGDPTRLKQILSNLINNALKFTGEGHVLIQVAVEERMDQRATLRFVVSDTGIGIPNEKIHTLFESFKQLDNSTTRKYGGTGLGLTIVKNLVEMMGGRITVESEPGLGTSFIFTIPFMIATKPPEEVKKSEVSSNVSLSGALRIIVAEDNKVNQELLRILLAKKNLKASFAENGKVLLQMLELKEYDLIFMDMQMPEMDGLEATMVIREKEKLSGGHIPIIALTANAMKGDRELCLNAGMDDYLTKPLRYNELSDMIDRHFKEGELT